MNTAHQLLDELAEIGVLAELGNGVIWLDPIEAVPPDLLNRVAKNKPSIVSLLETTNRLRVYKVINTLRSIKPYRVNDELKWRSEPTPAQHQLLHTYKQELLKALKPRPLTNHETGQIALLLRDINEPHSEHHHTYNRANESPQHRNTLLYMADGSPEYSDIEI